MVSYIRSIMLKSGCENDDKFVDFLLILQVSPVLARIFADLYLTPDESELLAHVVPGLRDSNAR